MPLIVDNTVATPWLIRPFEWGADIVVHSATKFIGGHGTSIGGVIVDAGSFDFSAGDRFPQFTEPDPSYHGLRLLARPRAGRLHPQGPRAAAARHRLGRSPRSTRFLILQGLETLSLRMERHNANAQKVAEYLDGHAQVESRPVRGPRRARGGTSGPKYAGGRGAGSVPAFIIEGGAPRAGQRFVEALELHSHVANIGDVRSLVIHPATTTHSPADRGRAVATGVDPGLVRLSVGLETIDDILADLDKGFAAAAAL